LSPNASPELFPEFDLERLTIPSSHCDNLRATLVRAELIHLRVLKFELRLPSPFEYLPRYLERALNIPNIDVESDETLEDYDSWGRERKEEDGVVDLMETRAGRAARAKVVDACVVFPEFPSCCPNGSSSGTRPMRADENRAGAKSTKSQTSTPPAPSPLRRSGKRFRHNLP